MKWLSVLKFIKHYANSILGKMGGLVLTPLIFPHRDWIRNYAWNYMRTNGIECERSTIQKKDGY